MVVPTAFLLVYLGQLNPEWGDVANLADASAFVTALKRELSPPAEEEGSGEETAAGEEPAVNNQQSGEKDNAETNTTEIAATEAAE